MNTLSSSQQLNPEQKKAVHHVDGPALVIAGAGSGKTRVVTHRIAHLLSLGIAPNKILAVTFTNKAAGEMRKRIEEQTQALVLTCTFHSFGARILRESIHLLGYQIDFTIYDEEDSEKVLKEAIEAVNLQGDKAVLKSMRGLISSAKNRLLSPDELAKEDRMAGEVYRVYETKLKSYHAVDFDDLLYLPIQLFKDHPAALEHYQTRWHYILIDEYQDTNAAQHTLIKMLSAKHHNVFAVGDPDQSIYSWRGADVSNILNFERDFEGALTITLDQNYRSRPQILNAANSLIHHNKSRYEKNLWSARGSGEKIGIYEAETDRNEAAFVALKLLEHEGTIPFNDCAVFYRTNFQSRVLEDHLLRLKIPYTIVGGLSFYQRREIKDMLALLRMVVTSTDVVAFSRMVNVPKRGLGAAVIERLKSGAEERGLPIFEFCLAALNGSTPFKLTPRNKEGLRQYCSLIEGLRHMAGAKVKLSQLVTEAIERSRYIDTLAEDIETKEERKENLGQLVSKAVEWQQETGGSLRDFLEELALKGAAEEGRPEGVKLMTLHNGKGLEFSVAFLVGMEENLFPHVNCIDDIAKLEEERRLCYVGMTRAKEKLYLSHAKYRFLWGISRLMEPSRFLGEILPEYTEDLSN
jgi:ATP-dependent DNA helicase UvrD/PcrA